MTSRDASLNALFSTKLPRLESTEIILGTASTHFICLYTCIRSTTHNTIIYNIIINFPSSNLLSATYVYLYFHELQRTSVCNLFATNGVQTIAEIVIQLFSSFLTCLLVPVERELCDV
jgi:hypothetical protein